MMQFNFYLLERGGGEGRLSRILKYFSEKFYVIQLCNNEFQSRILYDIVKWGRFVRGEIKVGKYVRFGYSLKLEVNVRVQRGDESVDI